MGVIDNLLARARQIKNATEEGENTALRVGGLMEDTLLYTSESLQGKQSTLVSGTNIKTINNQSILGSGNITIEGGGGGGGNVTGVKGDSESTYRTGNVNITKANIGLNNVGNFKAVSTVANQGLTSTEKANARTNIGAENTTYKFTIGLLTKGDVVNGVDLGTLRSENAQEGGTTLSLVTTGEKATWNGKVSCTSANVKTALGTGSGTTKYLREDGTWQIPSGGGGGGQAGTKVYLAENSGSLTQAMLISQNVVYVISYNYTIANGTTITVPSGCALEFAGGSINGGTLVLDNTYLYGNIKFGASITISGACKNETAYQNWFISNNVDAWHNFINSIEGVSCFEYTFGSYSPTVFVNKEIDNKGIININGNNAILTFSYTEGGTAYYIKPKNADTYRSAAISAIVNKGDREITVASVSNLNVGDIISIRDNTAYSFSPHREEYRHCEFANILAISGNTITLNHPVFGTYQHVGSCNVYAFNTISCHIKDLVLKVSNPTAVERAFTGIEIAQCVGVSLRNVKVYDFKTCVRVYASSEGMIENCVCKVTNTHVKVLINNKLVYPDSYGLSIANCQNFSVIGGDYVGGKHAVAIGGRDTSISIIDRMILVKNIRAKSIILPDFPCALEMHGDVEYVTIEGCTTSGIYCRGKNNKILNNFVYDYQIVSGELGNLNHQICGNTLKNSAIGIDGSTLNTNPSGWVKDSIEDTFTIKNNKTYDCPSIPSSYTGTGTVKPSLRHFVVGNISTSYYNLANTKVIVEGNEAHNAVLSIMFFNTIVVKNNIFSYDSDLNSVVRSIPKMTSSKLFIEGNKFIGYGHNPYYVGDASHAEGLKSWSYNVIFADYIYIKNNHVESVSPNTNLFQSDPTTTDTASITELYIEGNMAKSKFVGVTRNVGKVVIKDNIIEPTTNGIDISDSTSVLATKAFVLNNLVVENTTGVTEGIKVSAANTVYGRNVGMDTMGLLTPKLLAGQTSTDLDA